MDPIDIQYRLKKRGILQNDLVRPGRSASLISRVIHRKKKSARAERAIAKAIGEPVSKVFPRAA